MKKILINDGIHPDGKSILEEAGFQVDTDKIAQDQLSSQLPGYDAIVVRSATKVRKELIDGCPNLKVIARGGVGLDNIDVDHAKGKGITVINTPAASSQAVAELVFGHLFSLSRFLYQSNRNMPMKGDTEFKALKKSYAKGLQVRGKTIGIIGFGRIGQETARIALGMGMTVIPVDPYIPSAEVEVATFDGQRITVKLQTQAMEEMLAAADYISLHVPFLGKAVLDADEFARMKKGVIVVNAARGGVIDEGALLGALEAGIVAAAGLDVFENEPTPRRELLEHPRVSLSPHIGASTMAAQRNIGLELADKIIAAFNN